QIMLDAARHHTIPIEQIREESLKELERRYSLRPTGLEPQTFWRLTDNWLEISVRFIAKDHDVRRLKDQMSRDILAGFDEAGLSVASATYDIVGMPKLQVEVQGSAAH
ncbi:MAG: hypothetical protein JO185_01935, partial [Acidobacteriaceae bacterium]|nr:hypothetical protein [Acidobacteriaceae bacterium]